MPDYQCTYWPDTWFGVSLTPCCAVHDVSNLGLASSIGLGLCVADVMAAAHPALAVVGGILGTAMAFGTAVWCGLRYGPGGIRKR